MDPTLGTHRGNLLRGTALTVLVPAAVLAGSRPSAAVPPLARDPFTLGVASGDPAPDGFVIWTRLAPDPLVADGLGGMPSADYQVAWQVATDEAFTDVVRGPSGPDRGRRTRSTSRWSGCCRDGSTSTGSGRAGGSPRAGGR